jgi:uncharacterized protein YfiM (DUF2279 family)
MVTKVSMPAGADFYDSPHAKAAWSWLTTQLQQQETNS